MPRKSGAKLKKTPPTTVRFSAELHDFIKTNAPLHPDGQSGLINDAVRYYKDRVETGTHPKLVEGNVEHDAQDA